ncbi:hypothetical protein [Streptomyces sp. NPDC046197]|uniref:hypothetical protein n=1 Tax=Streptomyces sp. NPDC046197 TaxID=3154337 RepID=UPI0033FD7D51
MTLRDALAVLRHQGLVGTRRGRGGGTFVRAPADLLGERLRARLLAHTTEELRDLADHWAALAGAAARLAAERADAPDLEAPRRSLLDFAAAEDPAAMRRIDGRSCRDRGGRAVRATDAGGDPSSDRDRPCAARKYDSVL